MRYVKFTTTQDQKREYLNNFLPSIIWTETREVSYWGTEYTQITHIINFVYFQTHVLVNKHT
jgi:hypothetical protein